MIVETKTDSVFYLLLKAIDTIRLLSDFTLELKCKNFKNYQLQLVSENLYEVSILHSNLMRATNEDKLDELFPFVYKPDFNIVENGWTAYLPKEEFTELLMKGNWSLIRNNACNSYDKMVLLPANTSQEDIGISAKLHTNNRYPVLAFFYKENQSSLMRCAQYCSGQEKMGSADPVIRMLKFSYCFIDIRSKANIKNTPLEGRQLKHAVFPMEKVENLLFNFQKFVEVLQEPGNNIDRYLTRLEASHWLEWVRHMLLAARFVAHAMASRQGNFVVLGDTGQDMELVLTSLVQIILKQDARTVRGFQALVDREWIQAGHPFYERCRGVSVTKPILGGGDVGLCNESPVFLLFLDCVWQIMQSNPTAFEFNELLLKTLAQHAYFSNFGTFLGNCAEHREFYNIIEETTSLWSYLNQTEQLRGAMNHLYEPDSGANSGNSVCWPPVAPQQLEPWLELYCCSELAGDRHGVVQCRAAERHLEMNTLKRARAARAVNGRLRKLVEHLAVEVQQLEATGSAK